MLAIGTYTRELPHVKGIAKGVSFLLHDVSSGAWQRIGSDELDMGDGPSYIALRAITDRVPNRFLLVACNEGGPDELPATITSRCFTLCLDSLTRTDESEKSVCDVGSAGPCHLSLGPSGVWACAATYFGGATVSVAIGSTRGKDFAVVQSHHVWYNTTASAW